MGLANRQHNPVPPLWKIVVLKVQRQRERSSINGLGDNKASQTKNSIQFSASDYSELPDFVLRLNICLPPVALIALCCEWT